MKANLAVCMKPDPKDRKITCALPRGHGRRCSWKRSQSRAMLRNSQKPAQSQMLITLLREFARRTAQSHRENLQTVHSQLRVINGVIRNLLVATIATRPLQARQLQKGKVQ
jgi:hypothetical protein